MKLSIKPFKIYNITRLNKINNKDLKNGKHFIIDNKIIDNNRL